MEFIHQQKQEAQKRTLPNLTGIPTQMKLDFEQRSGLSFDDVRVHYSSEKPAQVQALAYTQGTQVYLGPGQERHLPHELGHVVQQKSGLVRPTRSANGLHINDDPALERQADHILEYGSLPSHSSGPDAVIQCAPGPGVGIELETSSIQVRVTNPPQEADKGQHPEWWQETFWKGKHLKEYSNWAITIDTTSFQPDTGLWVFSLEIVVDGTKLKLDSEGDVMGKIGADIRNELMSKPLNFIPEAINGFEIEKSGEITDNTNFSIQVTCAMPLDKVYDLLDSDTKNKLYPGEKANLSDPSKDTLVDKDEKPFSGEDAKKLLADPIFERNGEIKDKTHWADGAHWAKSKRTKKDKEIYTFLYLLQQIFASSHDPKQDMAAMPRTSMGKIFSMLSKEQQATISSYLSIPPTDDWFNDTYSHLKEYIQNPSDHSIGDTDGVSFGAYRDYLTEVEQEAPPITEDDSITKKDPITIHPEALGIGKLGDKTERGFSGEELPIFEFRKIGGCSLAQLPDYLKSINDDILKMLAPTET